MNSPVTGQGQPRSSPPNKTMPTPEELEMMLNSFKTVTNLLELFMAANSKHVKDKKKLRLDLAEAVMEPEQFEEHVEDWARLEINHANYHEIINGLEMERDNYKEVINNLKMQLINEKNQRSEEKQKEGEDKLKETEIKDDGGLKVSGNQFKEAVEFMTRAAAEWEVKAKVALE